MSQTALTVQQSPAFAAGVVVTAQATDAANGNSFKNDGRTSLRINNAAGAPINVTFTLPSTPRNGLGGFAGTLVVAVTNGTEKDFGFLDPQTFNDVNGNVLFQVSSATSVTAKVVQYVQTPV